MLDSSSTISSNAYEYTPTTKRPNKGLLLASLFFIIDFLVGCSPTIHRQGKELAEIQPPTTKNQLLGIKWIDQNTLRLKDMVKKLATKYPILKEAINPYQAILKDIEDNDTKILFASELHGTKGHFNFFTSNKEFLKELRNKGFRSVFVEFSPFLKIGDNLLAKDAFAEWNQSKIAPPQLAKYIKNNFSAEMFKFFQECINLGISIYPCDGRDQYVKQKQKTKTRDQFSFENIDSILKNKKAGEDKAIVVHGVGHASEIDEVNEDLVQGENPKTGELITKDEPNVLCRRLIDQYGGKDKVFTIFFTPDEKDTLTDGVFRAVMHYRAIASDIPSSQRTAAIGFLSSNPQILQYSYQNFQGPQDLNWDGCKIEKHFTANPTPILHNGEVRYDITVIPANIEIDIKQNLSKEELKAYQILREGYIDTDTIKKIKSNNITLIKGQIEYKGKVYKTEYTYNNKNAKQLIKLSNDSFKHQFTNNSHPSILEGVEVSLDASLAIKQLDQTNNNLLINSEIMDITKKPPSKGNTSFIQKFKVPNSNKIIEMPEECNGSLKTPNGEIRNFNFKVFSEKNQIKKIIITSRLQSGFDLRVQETGIHIPLETGIKFGLRLAEQLKKD